MPVSFWIFLAVSIVSFIPVFRDHSETNDCFKSSRGRAKFKAGVHLVALWIIPVFSLAGTVFLGVESISGDAQMSSLTTQLGTVSNKLETTESQLSSATNEISILVTTVNNESNDLVAAKVKPYKERLVDCLNSLNPGIMQSLKNGTVTHVQGNFEYSRIMELQSLTMDSAAPQFISHLQQFGTNTFAMGPDGNMYRFVSFDLMPTLMQ